MVKIAICDDEAVIIQQISALVKAEFEKYNEKVQVQSFDRPGDLIDCLKDKEVYDLVFLDIQMPDKTGIDVANFIREALHDDLTQIVFVSSESGYAMQLFEARPMDFLLKPVNEKQIERIVSLCHRLIENNRNIFQFSTRECTVRLNMSQINYFESRGRKIKVVTDDEIYEFYEKMDDLYERVKDYNFLYIHKSYIVNNAHIKHFTAKSVVMGNGEEVPVSRNRRGELKNLWD